MFPPVFLYYCVTGVFVCMCLSSHHEVGRTSRGHAERSQRHTRYEVFFNMFPFHLPSARIALILCARRVCTTPRKKQEHQQQSTVAIFSEHAIDHIISVSNLSPDTHSSSGRKYWWGAVGVRLPCADDKHRKFVCVRCVIGVSLSVMLRYDDDVASVLLAALTQT